MKLKKQYIQRIDSFLERLGCEYIDIRYEMVDHLASEIEEKVADFDDFFKKDKMRGKFLGFMMRKKNELLDNYSQQSKKQFWTNFVSIFKQMAKELLNAKVLLFIILTITTFKFLVSYNVLYAAITALVLAIISASWFFLHPT